MCTTNPGPRGRLAPGADSFGVPASLCRSAKLPPRRPCAVVWTNSGKIAARRALTGKEAERAGHCIDLKNEYVVSEVIEYKSWVCLICGWIYNEEEGLPEEGIPAGTRFAEIPEDWRCPLCDVGKAEFAVVEF